MVEKPLYSQGREEDLCNFEKKCETFLHSIPKTNLLSGNAAMKDYGTFDNILKQRIIFFYYCKPAWKQRHCDLF